MRGLSLVAQEEESRRMTPRDEEAWFPEVAKAGIAGRYIRGVGRVELVVDNEVSLLDRER
jgi:hypothetical protein